MRYLFTHEGYDYYESGKKIPCADCCGTGYVSCGLDMPCLTCNKTGVVDEIIRVRKGEQTK